MPRRDSVDKIVQSYFAAVAAEPFEYKGERYEVVKLTVSPLLLRGFTCPPGCGGCCPVFTLDYLPTEPAPYELERRYVEFNGARISLMSRTQEGRTEHHCSNLNMADGRCNVHGRQPFSCDFELIRFLHYAEAGEARMLTRLFGRGHAFLRVDQVSRGALCTITPRTDETAADVVRKLRRLAEWCDHFNLKHRVGSIIEWALGNPITPLVLDGHTRDPKTGLFY